MSMSSLVMVRRGWPKATEIGGNWLHQRVSNAAAARRRVCAAGSATSSSMFSYPGVKGDPKTLYEHPELYEAVFSYRDMAQEVSFLRAVYAKHASVVGEAAAPLRSVVELGCGPASHAIGLALGGVPHVRALDVSADMLGYARWKLERLGARRPGGADVRFVQSDMRDWALDPGDPAAPVDMAVCVLGTFSHCLDNDAASAAFGAAAAALRPGGLLVLELAHPGDLFDGTFVIGDGGKEVWEVPVPPTSSSSSSSSSSKGGDAAAAKILVEWGAEFDNFDPVTQVLHRTVSVNVLRGDEVVGASLEEVVLQRQFTVQEIRLLAAMHGLDVDGFYGDTALDVDLGHEEAYRMIAVLRRRHP